MTTETKTEARERDEEMRFTPLGLNAEAERDELASALSALRAEHQRAQEQAAAMREALGHVLDPVDCHVEKWLELRRQSAKIGLMPDAGKGWVSPEDHQRVVAERDGERTRRECAESLLEIEHKDLLALRSQLAEARHEAEAAQQVIAAEIEKAEAALAEAQRAAAVETQRAKDWRETADQAQRLSQSAVQRTEELEAALTSVTKERDEARKVIHQIADKIGRVSWGDSGRYVQAPDEELIARVEEISENEGRLADIVEEVRNEFGFPWISGEGETLFESYDDLPEAAHALSESSDRAADAEAALAASEEKAREMAELVQAVYFAPAVSRGDGSWDVHVQGATLDAMRHRLAKLTVQKTRAALFPSAGPASECWHKCDTCGEPLPVRSVTCSPCVVAKAGLAVPPALLQPLPLLGIVKEPEPAAASGTERKAAKSDAEMKLDAIGEVAEELPHGPDCDAATDSVDGTCDCIKRRLTSIIEAQRCVACGHFEVHCPSGGCNGEDENGEWCECERFVAPAPASEEPKLTDKQQRQAKAFAAILQPPPPEPTIADPDHFSDGDEASDE